MPKETYNHRAVRDHYPNAEIVGEGPWVVISRCAGERAFLFPDHIAREVCLNFGCSENCRGQNFHTAREIRQRPVKAQMFRVPGDWTK